MQTPISVEGGKKITYRMVVFNLPLKGPGSYPSLKKGFAGSITAYSSWSCLKKLSFQVRVSQATRVCSG